MKKIVYQGTKASYSEIAIDRFFGKEIEPIGKSSFKEVFQSLENEEATFAAIPIENSLIGPIIENFDLFQSYEVSIMGELSLPIEHCLVGKKGQKIEEIKKVLSHSKALKQCSGFFQAHPWIEPVVHFDTAGAAKEISEQNDPRLAAIGSRKTATVYSLEVLKDHLEDDCSNQTRFLFLQKKECSSWTLNQGKCSLLFTLNHVSGSLSEILLILAIHGLNLTQIVSRPIREKPFEYLFFADILFSKNNQFETILQTIKEKTQTLKLLGIYEPSK